MRISAQNQLKGIILANEHGVTTKHVKFNVGEAILAASITKTSAEKLTLAAGHQATAIVKASDVIVGVE